MLEHGDLGQIFVELGLELVCFQGPAAGLLALADVLEREGVDDRLDGVGARVHLEGGLEVGNYARTDRRVPVLVALHQVLRALLQAKEQLAKFEKLNLTW